MSGLVERKNGVSKSAIEKIEKVFTTESTCLILERASFTYYKLRGSKFLSALQFSIRYIPSISGIRVKLITQELLDAHIELESTCEMERLMG